MSIEERDLRKLLGRIFDACQPLARPDRQKLKRKEFIFHMTDWVRDLERLAELYRKPEKQQAAEETVVAFLSHAVPHLNAAGRLLLDEVPDTFAGCSKPGERSSARRTSTANDRLRRQKRPRRALASK